MRSIAVHTFITACALVCTPAFAATSARIAPANATQSAPDQAFLAMREAARTGDRAKMAQLAPQLVSHPLVGYAEYWQLLPRLRNNEPATEAAVADFLTRYTDTYIADRLRLDWALALADRGDFTAFDREARSYFQYRTSSGKTLCE